MITNHYVAVSRDNIQMYKLRDALERCVPAVRFFFDICGEGKDTVYALCAGLYPSKVDKKNDDKYYSESLDMDAEYLEKEQLPTILYISKMIIERYGMEECSLSKELKNIKQPQELRTFKNMSFEELVEKFDLDTLFGKDVPALGGN